MHDQATEHRQTKRADPPALAPGVVGPVQARLAATAALLNAAPPVQRLAAMTPNPTGMPDALKSGIEALSGLSMDHVRVHRNSSKPAQLQAHAFAQGSDIHLAPGQAHHLPHEAWHIVQQAQGRVRPTMQLKVGQLKAGTPVNDDTGLEREADIMGARALASGATGFTAQSATAPMTSAPLQARAVVQRMQWRWNAKTNSWEEASGNNSNTPKPTRVGTYDGEPYDDGGYSQKTDPTANIFMKPGESYMGERGSDKQLDGGKPSAEDIRVLSKPHDDLDGGSGLHEIVPTDMRGELASFGNTSLIGFQSGGRTATSKQLFDIGGDVGVHSGFSVRGYTSGQKGAHDRLRQKARELKDETDSRKVVNEMMLRHLETTPTGQQILSSDYLEGMTPKRTGFGTLGPVSKKGPPDPHRLAVAEESDRGRERVKRRVRAEKRRTGIGRSPSPPRRSLAKDGTGGEHIVKPNLSDEIEAVPDFPTGEYEYSAQSSSWMTAPMRERFVGPPLPVHTPTTTISPPSPSTGVGSQLLPPSLGLQTIMPPTLSPPPMLQQPQVQTLAQALGIQPDPPRGRYSKRLKAKRKKKDTPQQPRGGYGKAPRKNSNRSYRYHPYK